MRLYIAGPMTGLPDLNYPAFRKAEEKLQAHGYETLNPVDNEPEVKSWLNFMRMSLVQISMADGIALLPDWETSKGAVTEFTLATNLGLPILNHDRWLTIHPDFYSTI